MDLNSPPPPTFLQIFLRRFQIMSNLKCGGMLNEWCTWQLRSYNGEAIKGERSGLQSLGDHFNAVMSAQLCLAFLCKTAN